MLSVHRDEDVEDDQTIDKYMTKFFTHGKFSSHNKVTLDSKILFKSNVSEKNLNALKYKLLTSEVDQILNSITMTRKSNKHLRATYGTTGKLFQPY